jgi:ligand-binding sensor domain-containing protein/signal transduction histidine kinase
MHPISKDEYWIVVRDQGLFRWNRRTNNVTRHSDLVQPSFIHRTTEDQEGNIWLASRTGLYKLDTVRKLHRITHDPDKPEWSPSVDVIRDVIVDREYLWLATENGGLNRMDRKTGRFTHFMHTKNDPWSFSDNSVWAVYKDRQGRLWSGTFSKGLCVFDQQKEKFAELDVNLENDVVNAIWKDSRKRIWIATEGGLVMKDGDQTSSFFSGNGLTDPKPIPFLSIFEDSKKRMWFGTWEAGMFRYDEVKKDFVQYKPDPARRSSLSDSHIYSISEQKSTGHLLVCTYRGLNMLVDENEGEFIHYFDSTNEANNYTRVVFEDRKHNIWMGSITMLNRFDRNLKLQKTYLFDEDTGDGNYVYCISETDTDLWVGSNKGLYHMRGDQVIESYDTRNGMPNSNVNAILPDNNGMLWVSTADGLSRFDPTTKIFINYDISDGLLSNQFKPNAAFRSYDDGLLFVGGKGVNIFYPDSVKRNPIPPPVYLTGLKIFNEEILTDNDILPSHISELKELTLKPEYNFFTLEYVAVNLTSSERNQFSYKLEGFNSEWITVGTQRFATFTNLDPGTYTFRVMASNNDGVWNNKGTSIVIHILPPWWKTWWFKTSLILLVIGLSVMVSIVKTRNIKRVNQRLKKTVRRKTKTLRKINTALILQDEEIKIQNKKLTEQREELAAQNEELIQTQEEIASQRDILALQNKNLSEAQAIIAKQNEEITTQNENLEIEVLKRTQELVDYNHQLEQFAFAAAHSLRGPVARILGLGQLLELRKMNAADKEEIYPKLIYTTKELDTVVKDLNAILELNMNHNSLVSDIELGEEIAFVCENFEQKIKSTGTMIQSDFREVSSIRTVKRYLDSILYHLISNAIKYRHPIRPPVILLKTKKLETEVCLSVSDNGLGIDMSQFSGKIFTMYRRFHTHVEGKGIGLYLVKTQVEALGGRIEVESAVEVGTTFKIYIKDRRH